MQEGHVRMLRQMGVISIAAALMVAACDEDDPAGPAAERFTADLRPENESPPVTSTATGTGTFTLTGRTLDWDIVINNWPAGRSVSAAHIHFAPVTGQTSGGVMQGFPVGAGGIGTGGGSGTIVLRQTTADSVRAGGTYFNVHSSVNMGGEIRGTIVRQP
jgi:CHRD domain